MIKPPRIKLKSYVLKTQILIGEVRDRYKIGPMVDQPFSSYYFIIKTPTMKTTLGGIKNKKELFKKLAEEFR